MTDLQCPATFFLVALETARGEARHLAGVYATQADAAAVRFAEAGGCALEILSDVADGPALVQRIDELADLHRGETVAVLAPREMLEDALERAGADDEPPVTVAIDSSGWRLT